MLTGNNILSFLTLGFYRRKDKRDSGTLPDTLRPDQRAFYYFVDGVPIVSPKGQKIDESGPIGKMIKKTVFRCAAYSCRKADDHFARWAAQNIGKDGKLFNPKRRKFLGLFTLLLLASMQVSAQHVKHPVSGPGNIFTTDTLVGSNMPIVQDGTDQVLDPIYAMPAPPSLRFKYHDPMDMAKFQLCDERGHVQGPGLQLDMHYESIPYVEDTDSTSTMVYPGVTRIEHGCLRCGLIITETITDLRRPIWVRREQTGKR